MSKSSFGPTLPILSENAFDDFDNDTRAAVLITGAAGNLGSKLRSAWQDRYDLILFDKNTGDDPEIIAADLAVYDDSWAAYFDEADVVVHLAATPNEFSNWDALVQPNIDAVCNVYQAAIAAGVGRVILASSNHVMGGYRFEGDPNTPITEDLPPKPGNPYGACKLFAERLGVQLSQGFGFEFIALRLGWIQSGPNRIETLPDDWAKALWLSNADLVQLFEKAIETPLPQSQSAWIFNGLSDNSGSRWNLDLARAVLGYQPKTAQ